MILYHFTSTLQLGMILADGVIKTTESNIGSGRPDWPPYGEHVAPDVVWLTDEAEPTERAIGVDGGGIDKTAVRISIDVQDHEVIWWPDFADEHKPHRRWRKVLEHGRDAESWWVVTRPILVSEFVAVDQLGARFPSL